jgi:hypothetical protein
MFRPIRIILLLIISLPVTAALYYIDSDLPTDGLYERFLNYVLVTVILFLLYAAVVGMAKLFNRLSR